MKAVRYLALVLAILALPVALFATGQPEGAAGKGSVVVYSALDEKTTNAMAQRFTEETGIQVELLNVAAAGTLAARIQSEAAAPKADVFIGGSVEIHQPLADAGLLTPYKSPEATRANVPATFLSPDGSWSGWYFGPLVLIINQKLFDEELKPKGLDYPKTWDDLLNPGYKGQLIGWNPSTVGGGYIFVITQISRLGGEEQGFAWLKKFDQNVKLYGATGPSPIPLVARGEAIAAVAWADDSFLAKDEGQPITIIFPEQDGAEIGGASIIKGGPNLANAKRFIDFLYEKDIQKLKSDIGFTYPVRPDVTARPDVPSLKDIHLVNYMRQFAIENKARIVKKWEDEIGSKRK
jgi:iron(III) transport system substrate-binding protein